VMEQVRRKVQDFHGKFQQNTPSSAAGAGNSK
jgi:hypothetical protein